MKFNNSPLSFYFNMLFKNSIQSVKQSFIGNKAFKKEGFSYIQEHGYYMKNEMIQEDKFMPVFSWDIIGKDDFFKWLIDLENKNVYENIEVEISNILENKDKVTYIEGIYDDLGILLKRLSKLEDADADHVEDKLLEIIIYLKDMYSNLIKHHNVFKYLIKKTSIPFFRDKDLKHSFFVDLYKAAGTLQLINDDDSEIEEIDFIDAFTSPNPQVLKNKIKFSSNNYVVAYFLESLKPFFHEFTYTKIELSEAFLNKQNKLLTSNDISASLSRGKGKIDVEKSEIDERISGLKEKYLK